MPLEDEHKKYPRFETSSEQDPISTSNVERRGCITCADYYPEIGGTIMVSSREQVTLDTVDKRDSEKVSKEEKQPRMETRRAKPGDGLGLVDMVFAVVWSPPMKAVYIGCFIGLIQPVNDLFFHPEAVLLFLASTAKMIGTPYIGVMSLLVGSALGRRLKVAVESRGIGNDEDSVTSPKGIRLTNFHMTGGYAVIHNEPVKLSTLNPCDPQSP